MPTPEPGVYPGVSYEDYNQWDGMRSTVLKAYCRSAADGKFEQMSPSKDTPAFRLGRAFHSAVLEPGKFDSEYATLPKVDRRTRAGKAAWAAFEAENTDKDLLSPSEMWQCRAMNSAVWAHPIAREILESPGMAEVSGLAEIDGMLFKVRADWFCEWEGRSWIFDLKSTKNAEPTTFGFGRSAAQFNYHISAALYLDVFAEIAPVDRAFGFIAVEKEFPYLVSVMELGPHEIHAGRTAYQKGIETYRQSLETGEYPGYPEELHQLQLPDWALQDAEYSIEQQLEDYGL